jgi:hypothetical protein
MLEPTSRGGVGRGCLGLALSHRSQLAAVAALGAIGRGGPGSRPWADVSHGVAVGEAMLSGAGSGTE